MQKKIDFILKLGIILFAIFIFSICIFGMQTNHLEINGTSFTINNVESIAISISIAIVIIIVSFLAPPGNIILIYLIYRSITKNKIRNNAKFEKQNLEYCRDHFNNLSPEMLSYLNDFSIEFEKDISAHILKLLYQKYLIVENEKLIPINKDNPSLSVADHIVLEIVEQRQITTVMKKKYEKAIFEEAKAQGFISFKNSEGIKLGIQFISFLFIFTFLFQMMPTIFQGQILNVLGKFSIFMIFAEFIMILIPSLGMLYFFASFFSLLKYKTNIIRSKKGNQIQKNALGLKKFLRDFSSLDQSSWKEVYTRDYYLIYAVVLGINKKIPKEIIEMLKN